MSKDFNLKMIGPIVDFALVGEVHNEDGKLIVGDTDVVRLFQAKYGGHRQNGHLQVTLHLLTSESTEVSPSGDGVFAERSEPV